MVVNFALNEIDRAAREFLALLGDRKTVAFHGEMGAGKTTFIHALCKVMGVEDVTSSPTFSIINEYKKANGETVLHMDLYRLRDEQEAVSAGVEDGLFSGNLCLVEWPEKAKGIFPEDAVHCYITVTGSSSRKLQINL
ncbi:MAG: tRNA (adenosine(37)-N6)-threonylcarbamoyltransferase complex ATPase subunit type 1 TsaE [Ferruginibacter sp.]